MIWFSAAAKVALNGFGAFPKPKGDCCPRCLGGVYTSGPRKDQERPRTNAESSRHLPMYQERARQQNLRADVLVYSRDPGPRSGL